MKIVFLGNPNVSVSILSSLMKTENDKSGIIFVEDNGKGIERHNWNNIFKEGFTTKLRGWGIGLSLVKRIIEELHHG